MASEPKEDNLADGWYDHKTQLMCKSLGEEHDTVMHSIIPYAVGGALDLYYYPRGLPGTAIATKELSELPTEGSQNDVYRSYELVMFTRQPLDLESALDQTTAFGRTHKRIHAILNLIARYSTEATLNPNETCEVPGEFQDVGGACLIFDGFARHTDDVARDFGLLAIIEVFRSEMEFARQRGGKQLLDRLRARGVYPYSDMDREPVA